MFVRQSFVYALLHLAANPQYMQPLREEVESVLKEESGMSKAAIVKMRRVDSFLKECQRINALDSGTLPHDHTSSTSSKATPSTVTMLRSALRDYTFSDGTTVPAGTFVAAAKVSSHFNDEFYDDPYEFDPWRFVALRDKDGEGIRHQMVHMTHEYMPFGFGKHAWCAVEIFVTTPNAYPSW